MWQCPKCNRAFKNTNQSHFCQTTPATIEAYILQQPKDVQPFLLQIHETIKAALTDAVEKISWQMPTYWKKHNLIQFAAAKNHIGLYPGPEAVDAFSDKLQDYKTHKGTIQLPYQLPLPLELITEIARWCEDNYGV